MQATWNAKQVLMIVCFQVASEIESIYGCNQ